MKIGFFCNEYPPRPHGGIGTFVHTLAPALAQAGHVVTVVEWGERAGERQCAGVRVVTLAQSTTRHIAWLINRQRLWRWLRAEVHAGRIDLFEVPEYQGCLPFPWSGCPVVVRLHLAESHIRSVLGGAKGRVYWLEKGTLLFNRNWIGVSQYILNETQRFFAVQPRVAEVIYNPATVIDGAKLPIIEKRFARYVVYNGTVSERKGALLLADAMRTVFAQDADIRLVYVGPETEHDGRPISAAIRDRLGDQSCRVFFTGRLPHDQALAWVRNAAALVLVSRIEAMPLVPIEAMSLGVPVVCANVGPGPEIVDNGIDGVLVSPVDPQALAQSILALLKDPANAKAMGEAGQRKVKEKFELAVCLRRTEAFYRKLLEQPEHV